MGSNASPTVLLERLREGERGAAQPLFEILYAELRIIAGRVFGGQERRHTLQPTALVHEAFVKLVAGNAAPDWQSRAHFFNLAARAMRQILVNHARDRAALKRGGGAVQHFDLREDDAITRAGVLDAVALDEALSALAEQDERLARIAEVRLFGGLSAAETAEVLGVSKRTVETDWALAKAWLSRRLAPGD